MTLRRFRLVLVLVVMSVLFLQFVPAARLERLETITLDPAKMDESMLARLQHVEIGMQIMADHPLFGTGLGSFPEVKKKYLPRGYAARDEHVAHNTLIQMGSEVGLIFLGVFVAFNFYAVWCLLRRSPEAFNGPDADHMDWVRSGLAAALAASAVQMLKGDMAMVDYFWWIYGLSVAYHMVRRKAVEASAVLPVQPSAPVVPKRSWRPWLKPARVGS
jgi:O-antigen ligase